MDLISIIVVFVVVALILWLVTTYIPMPEPFKRVLIAIVVLFLVLWLARAFLGGGGPVMHLR